MPSDTHKSKQEIKKHGDTQASALKRSVPPKTDPVPMPEHGSHAHSHAAHLGGAPLGRTSTAANTNPRNSGQLREPPQQLSRIGKQHR